MCFEEVKVSASIIDSIYHKLDTLGTSNIVIVSSDDDVFVTDLLSKLHACRNPGMVVYGLPDLVDFNHVSIYDLMGQKIDVIYNDLVQTNTLKSLVWDASDFSSGDYFVSLKTENFTKSHKITLIK